MGLTGSVNIKVNLNAVLDEAAELTTAGDGFFPKMRQFYLAHPELRMLKGWKT